MFVSRIESINRQKVRVHILEGEKLVLYRGELGRFSIREEGDLPEETYREIVDTVLTKRAISRAMHLLVRRMYTRAGLRGKLTQDGYPAEAVDSALEYVEQFHYVDDQRYVEQYLLGPGAGKGIRAVEYELQQKGIDREVIRRVLADREPRDEYEIVKAAAQKKLGAPHRLDEKEYRRAYGYLARKGFDGEKIRKVLEEFQTLS